MNELVDIHCHLLPGIDDGAADLEASLAMAHMSLDQGVDTIVVTPHQLGAFDFNRGDDIRRRTGELQAEYERHGVPLRVLPGAELRVEERLLDGIDSGDLLTLGDLGRHVLLELPHELYLPLEPVLEGLKQRGMVGILAHPERNAGLLADESKIDRLVDAGCLMQVTASSLAGGHGPSSQAMAERMATRGLIHFLSTDSHSPKRRRPRLGDAYETAVTIVGEDAAWLWCGENPRAVAEGRDVAPGRTAVRQKRRGWSLFSRSAA